MDYSLINHNSQINSENKYKPDNTFLFEGSQYNSSIRDPHQYDENQIINQSNNINNKYNDLFIYPNHLYQFENYLLNSNLFKNLKKILKTFKEYNNNEYVLKLPSFNYYNFIYSQYKTSFISDTIFLPICRETYSKKKELLLLYIIRPTLNIRIEYIIQSNIFIFNTSKLTKISEGVYCFEYSVKTNSNQPHTETSRIKFNIEFNINYNNEFNDTLITPDIIYLNSSKLKRDPFGNIYLFYKYQSNINNEIDVSFFIICNSIKKGKKEGEPLLVIFKKVNTEYIKYIPQFLNGNQIIMINGNTIEFRAGIEKGLYNIGLCYNRSDQNLTSVSSNIIPQITNYLIQ